MKISYNWLKQYLPIQLPASEVADLLTDCGLEVEHSESFQSIKGGLDGLVIGEVISKEKHPNADKLSLTKVDVGTGTLLSIVCGGPNVAAGQKVVIALIGSTLYPIDGEPFKIKESKIRGELSQGMICAEDEIGLGHSHEGVMVLDENAVVGSRVNDYFKIENDTVFEIGLTPNRADAASHIGVARDLSAIINMRDQDISIQFPSVDDFSIDNNDFPINVIVEDDKACPRYSGITISGVEIKDSPEWLKNRLKSIGLKPINNIVDATNFVLHELGQPLHAFDADYIKGKKVVVKKYHQGTKFITLDGVERTLLDNDLMISNADEPMCIAGVFGGIKSGVKNETKNIFLESAYFDPVHIRKSSRHHGLKTDASFRFERGTDPNITVYALKRAALLIKEIAGGTISSDIVDVYPSPIENFRVELNYKTLDRLIGLKIDREKIKKIITSLEIKIIHDREYGLELSVPPFKVDVQRDVDIIEEIIRIYGYNNIPISEKINASITYSQKPDKEKIADTAADFLSSNGFNEIMSNSLTKADYIDLIEGIEKDKNVIILNPLSNELNAMRQSMLFSGLEAVSYNKNRRNHDLKLYEFGKTYHKKEDRYIEIQHLALFITGRRNPESWNNDNLSVDYYQLKGYVESLFKRLGIRNLNVTIESVKKSILKHFDINSEVFYADINWDKVIKASSNNAVKYKEVPKFPEVRRDLALVINKEITYQQIEELANKTERNLLKSVNLFDVYEGDKIEAGKKSYAVSFILQDEEKTLNDKQIDKVMERLMEAFEKNLQAVIRK
jgi:phenylalanyl-tRNA synthetase beta chain